MATNYFSVGESLYICMYMYMYLHSEEDVEQLGVSGVYIYTCTIVPPQRRGRRAVGGKWDRVGILVHL